MEYRTLSSDEAELLRSIDRSEQIAATYRLERGRLVLHPDGCVVSAFEAAELERLVSRQRAIVAGGGRLLGAFEDGRIAGMASVERRLRGRDRDRVKMDVLYVSAPFRGRGVGRALVARVMEAARAMGAALLYVSATPTRRTVDFYLRCGARLAREVDPELLAVEPEDIHLELPLTP